MTWDGSRCPLIGELGKVSDPGQDLIVLEEDGRLLVQTRMQAVHQAQEIVRKMIPPGSGSAVEELFKLRREEIELENQKVTGSSPPSD